MARPPRFHTKPLRRQRKPWVRSMLPWLTLLLAAGIAAVIMRLPDRGGEWEAVDTRFSLCGARDSDGCVIDGDTIMLGRRKIRMAGYNAPEIKGECPAETALAAQSRDHLRDWLSQGRFTMDGGTDPPRDQYGRELRAFKRGDEWLADEMLGRQLAQQTGWGFTRGGWCD